MFASEMSSTKKKAFTSESEIQDDQSTEVKNEDNSKYIDMALARKLKHISKKIILIMRVCRIVLQI